MNILIEDAETLEYLAGDNKWTRKVSEGRTFKATDAAYQVAKKEPIGRFNIVFYISQTEQFINMSHGRGRGPAEAGSLVENVPAAENASIVEIAPAV